MTKISIPGKYFYAVAILAFGIIQIVAKNFMKGLLPVPGYLPARILFVNILSIAFIALALRIIINKSAKISAVILGFLLLLLFIFPHVVLLLSNIYDPNEWTVALEMLAICSGAFILAGIIEDKEAKETSSNDFVKRMATAGYYGFSLSVVGFCVLQFKYVHFVSTLIPAWIPFHIFFAYLVSLGFL